METEQSHLLKNNEEIIETGETAADNRMADIYRDRAGRLFTYLKELYELQYHAPIKDIKNDARILETVWFHRIPHSTGCHCIAWDPDNAGSGTWLSIEKPALENPPPLPQNLEDWVKPWTLNDSSLVQPELVELTEDEIEVGELSSILKPKIRRLMDFPELQPVWENYLRESWQPWQLKDRENQRIYQVYADLYSMYQKQQRLGESYEVILGLGYLTWNTPTGSVIRRHLLNARVSLVFDSEKAIISLEPGSEGARLEFEEDMLEASERPGPDEQLEIERLKDELGDEIWGRTDNGKNIHTILASWINAIQDSRPYSESLFLLEHLEDRARVVFAPAVILRKRLERSLIRLFKEISEQITENRFPLPEGVLEVVKDPATDSHSTQEKPALVSGLHELYFPLPSNAEQERIAAEISSHSGVLVQGPPGTGKSQTIANLVCHLLAEGQRVLVTSHTGHALSVLRKMLPEDIAPLCVVAIAEDHESKKALETSVKSITQRKNKWIAAENEIEIKQLEVELAEARREEVRTVSELAAMREGETQTHSFSPGAYEGTLQTIAGRLHEEEAAFGWMPVTAGVDCESPLTNLEAVELLHLLRQPELNQEFNYSIIDPAKIELPTALLDLIKKEKLAQEKYDGIELVRQRPAYNPLCTAGTESRESLAVLINQIKQEYTPLKQSALLWVQKAASAILSGDDQVWLELERVTTQLLNTVSSHAESVIEADITGLGSLDRGVVRVHALALLEHLESGGGLGFGPFRPHPVKEGFYLINEVRINGKTCSECEPLRDLLSNFQIADCFEKLAKNWRFCAEPPQGTFRLQKASYEGHLLKLIECLSLRQLVTRMKEIVNKVPGLPLTNCSDIEELNRLQETLDHVVYEDNLKAAKKEIQALIDALKPYSTAGNAHPVTKELISAIQRRSIPGYEKSYQQLLGLKDLEDRINRKNELLKWLEEKSILLEENLTRTAAKTEWENRLAHFEEAWNWARADFRLRQIHLTSGYRNSAGILEEHRRKIQQILARLAAAKAWQNCLSRLTEAEDRNLKAWYQVFNKIPKGQNAKSAPKYRRQAREFMAGCRSAIPAWIMPIYRIADSVDIKPDIYDVAIIDEASQSGLEALFLQYIARKVIVVGDPRQISPSFIGIDREDVESLRRRRINDLPYGERIEIDSSFFDLAWVLYPGQVQLREHFRCMPEIIEFSNRLCYSNDPLIPLKQYGLGRLSPVIKTVHVENGFQSGRTPGIINPPEAETIAACIAGCCADPRYLGKTMGVISLLGEEQAREIQKRLLETIGPEEMERRQILCGDAYAFQGDERDIMFLSLVSALGENHHIATLTTPVFEQRFNVAASRAREQMWLFHSVTLEDLNSQCFRYRLLDYCLHPKIEQTGIEVQKIEELREKAKHRHPGDPCPAPFESWLTVDVFLQIVDRGFKVFPRYNVAGYIVDLVVQGTHGRLAVECDGDIWQGPEQYLKDMARQRQLERAGLQFWRVRGSTYFRHPETALDDLWRTLENNAIQPMAEDNNTGFQENPMIK